MKTIIENVIKKGGYDLAELLARIDTFFAEGKLTAEEREELYALARVEPKAKINVEEEITKLWRAVKVLQGGTTSKAKDFVQPTGAHDAYNTGDKVIFEKKTYVSLIDGNVWSPSTYPSGWASV